MVTGGAEVGGGGERKIVCNQPANESRITPRMERKYPVLLGNQKFKPVLISEHFFTMPFLEMVIESPEKAFIFSDDFYLRYLTLSST